MDDIIDEEHRERVVTKLHEVLRPFLLRRLKKDVNIDLPEKKELVVYAQMSPLQHDYYRLAQAGTKRKNRKIDTYRHTPMHTHIYICT